MEDNRPAVRNRMEIPWYQEGKDGPSLFSANDRNTEVALLRALSNPQVAYGTTANAILSDSNFTIVLPTSTTASAVTAYKLKDVKGDYLIGRTWDGTTEGGVDVAIAKEYLHRESLTAETLLAESHTYTYSDGVSETWGVGTFGRFNRIRTDNDGSSDEAQRIVPPWRENEVIQAVSSSFTGVVDASGAAVTIMISGRSCQWAKKSS
jgi:hypothetical protein